MQHRLLDRRLVKDFLLDVARGSTSEEEAGRNRDEQYAWLKGIVDPRSKFEREFLDFLYERGYKLPDSAQNRPTPEIAAQPDFYFERGAVPGVCVYVDGSAHDMPERQERDQVAREALEDRGYRVITVRFDEDIEAQVSAHPDVFSGS